MRLADTNVLLDFCGLSPERDARARFVAGLIESVGEPLVVTEVVLAEAFWALSSEYGIRGLSAVDLVQMLLSGAEFRAWDTRLACRALELKRRSPALDIADCILAARSIEDGDVVVTHDRSLNKLVDLEQGRLESRPNYSEGIEDE